MNVRIRYLLPYFCVSACNWLQGPYFYSVYKTKFAPENVEDGLKIIYICGYTMSLLSSIFAGFWTDRLGRKGASMCCCFLYILSCISVHSNYMPTLIIGRILGGFASTLFHTAFESWLNDSKTDSKIIGELFYLQTSLGGIVAILSGGISFYSTKYFGLFGSFRVSAMFSLLGALFIGLFWKENYGGGPCGNNNNSNENKSSSNNIEVAVKTIPLSKVIIELFNNQSLLLLGLSQILFEAPMHVFIMLWNPALQDAANNDFLNVKQNQQKLDVVSPLLAPGVTFSIFMFALMIGSHVVSIFSRKLNFNPESALIAVFSIAACSLFCASKASYLSTIVLNNYDFGINNYSNGYFYNNKMQFFVYFFFILYEFSVGVYFPSIAVCRSYYIPNTIRASITSIYRVPQNLFVIVLLLYKADLKIYQRLQMSATALFLGVFTMAYLKSKGKKKLE